MKSCRLCRGQPNNKWIQPLPRRNRVFRQWRRVTVADRAAALRKVGGAMRARGEELAQMISLEMGKPIARARGEVSKSANLCDWYAEHGPAMLATEATRVEDNKAVIEYRPLGPILAVMPWNFPVWQGSARRGTDSAGWE